nr:HEPN domain-containing protein [Thermus scotoductus]
MRQAPQVVNRDGLYCLCGAKPGLYPSSEKDLEHARFALEKGFYEWAAFSAQQSAPRGCGLGALGAGSFGGAGQAASRKRVPPRRSQRAG